MLENIKKDIDSKSNPNQAKNLQRFFKTGKGEYGEGDIFLGLKVPQLREIAKEYSNLELNEVQDLLNSKIHEHRMAGLFILINKCKNKNSDKKNKKRIFEFYLKNTKNINNWDLVDLSAPNIVGDYLFNNKEEKKILYELVKSKNLWERRIAMVSTFAFIRNNEFEDALKLSEILLKDKHDLIHKAVGWVLREIGKKDKKELEKFLKENYKIMPRTTLRYSIERFPKKKERNG